MWELENVVEFEVLRMTQCILLCMVYVNPRKDVTEYWTNKLCVKIVDNFESLRI